MALNQELWNIINIFKGISRKYPDFYSFNEVELQTKYWYETGKLIDLDKFEFKTIKEMLISSGEFDDERTSYGTRLVPRYLTNSSEKSVVNAPRMTADDCVRLNKEASNSGYDGMGRFTEVFQKLGIEKSASSGAKCEENIRNNSLNCGRNNTRGLSSNTIANISAAVAIIPNEEKLQLPWDQPKWDVKITFPKSTTEVWARLADTKSMVSNHFNRMLFEHPN